MRPDDRHRYRRDVARLCVIAFLVSVLAAAFGLEGPLAQETDTTPNVTQTDDSATEEPTLPETEGPTPDQGGEVFPSETNPAHEISALQQRFVSEKLLIIQEFHDTLIATVYWALGTVAFLAIAVLGFVWIAFTRNFDREKASLKAELTGELQSALAELKTEIAEERQALGNEVQKQMSSFQEKTRGQVDSFEENLSAFEKRLDRLGKDASESATKLLLPRINDLRVETSTLEMRFWRNQEIWANVLICGTQLIERLKEAEKGSLSYDFLLFEIKNAVMNIEEFDSPAYSYLERFLRLVPKSHVDIRDEIASIAETKKKNKACLSGLHPHPLGLEWSQIGYRGARHGCSRPRRSPIPAFATRVPATFPR